MQIVICYHHPLMISYSGGRSAEQAVNRECVDADVKELTSVWRGKDRSAPRVR